jgi:hypothetical protein
MPFLSLGMFHAYYIKPYYPKGKKKEIEMMEKEDVMEIIEK